MKICVVMTIRIINVVGVVTVLRKRVKIQLRN